MAVVTVKSLALTNRDSSPVILSNDVLTRGIVKSATGMVPTTAGDSIASIYKLVSLPSNAVIKAAFLSCDAMAGSTAGTFDAYDTTANGGAIIATTGTKFLSGGVSLVSALAASSIYGGGTSAAGAIPSKQEKFIWDILGFTADPNKYFDICLTLTAAVTTGGNLALHVLYV